MTRSRGHKDYQTIPPIGMTDDVDVGGGGGCSIVLAVISFIIVIFTFPFSLIYSIKVSVHLYSVSPFENCTHFNVLIQ